MLTILQILLYQFYQFDVSQITKSNPYIYLLRYCSDINYIHCLYKSYKNNDSI
jgi:hypothetical protein